MVVTITKKSAVSNKTPTLPKYKPFIDKISVVIPIQAEDSEDIYSNIWQQIEDKAVFNQAGYKAKGQYKLAKRINLELPSRPLFQFDYENGKALKFRIEFNPRKVGPCGLLKLHAVLTSLCPGGWDYVVQHGAISRIDIAVDIPNARPGMFGVVPLQGLSTKEWSVAGKLQTLVLGAKKGNQTLLYNKKALRLKQGQKWDGKASVRIERRLKNPSTKKLADLPLMDNPFAGITLTNFGPQPLKEKKSWVWSLFKDSVATRGVPAALAQLPKEKRTLYRNHLKLHAYDQWSPDEIWNAWPSYLNEMALHQKK